MTKRFFLWIFLLGLLGCNAAIPTPSPTATGQIPLSSTLTVESDGGLHLVVALQGQMSVKRQDWSDYAPALFGTLLRRGDLLRLESGSQAKIACDDWSLASVPSGIGGVPCKVAKMPPLVYDGSQVITTRDYAPGEFPIVISPRKTKLISPNPTLRWTPVPGVVTYTVSVRGPNLNWSTDVASKTEVAYPTTAPVLVSGTAYRVVVCGGSNCSDKENIPDLGFTTLKPDEVQTVREAGNRIRALGLADAPTRFLISSLYATQDLHTEAIEQLEGLTSTLEEPAVLRLLGDLYRTIGLNRLAEERYLQALGLSQKANDVEGQALAQYWLGQIYDALGNKSETIQRLQKAMELYQKLGDSKKSKEIQERLTELQKP